MSLIKCKLFCIPTAVSLLMLSASGFSADGTINFTGEFIATTCDIQIDNGPNNSEINLGIYNIKALANVGDLTTSKMVNISLTDCPVQNKDINLEFVAANTTSDGLTYKVTGANPISTSDIGIALFKDDAHASQIVPASTMVPVTLTNDVGSAKIYASFKRIQNSGPLQADKITATATFNINYL
ncbi:fimbrial protein [Providencia sp. Je.9.19]|uniref:fimbrial protein n=1 Tax=unclassified Providencia TaxID=2633465 RepID=UPI003DA7E075